MAFQKPNAQVKPTVAAIGYLSGLEDAYLSKNGVYSVLPFELEGKYGSMNGRGNLIFLPEWFSPGFSPLTLESSQENVYRMHIAGAGDRSLSTLEGLAGSREAFDALGEAKDELAEYTTESVGAFLSEFFNKVGAVDIGYILKQRMDKMDDGSRVRSEFYEIGGFFFPTEEAIHKLVERERKSIEKPGKGAPFRVGFDLRAAGVIG